MRLPIGPSLAPGKLNNIQVLRAFAAIDIVVYHCGIELPILKLPTTFGVEVFFVISGYIMARILDPRFPSNSEFFFRRRTLRIVPPYWFFTFVLFAIAMAFPQLMGATRANVSELIKSLLFIPYIKGNGLMHPLLFVGWSLNYEMFFYAALSLGLLISKRRAVWLGSIFILLLMAVLQPFRHANHYADFYGNFISLDFLIGIACYEIVKRIPRAIAERLRWPSVVVSVSCVMGLLLSGRFFFAPSPQNDFLIYTSIMAFPLVLCLCILSESGWDTRLRLPILLGDASYVLYLVHPFCFLFLERVVARRVTWLAPAKPVGAVGAIAFSCATAVMFHYWCERPLLRTLNHAFGGKRKSAEFSVPAFAESRSSIVLP